MKQVQEMLRAARKKAKETGQTLDDILLGICYDNNIPARDQLAAIKVFKQFTMPHLKEDGPTDKNFAPPIALPKEEDDPAKVVSIEAA